MKIVKCKYCGKKEIKINHAGSFFCNRGCYFKWRKNNPNRRAYKSKILVSGYYYLYMPNHPFAVKKGRYIAEHRYIAEKKIGRYLKGNEIAHHINGNKLDNRLENIKVMTICEHNRLTYKKREKDKYGKLK